MVYDFIFPQSPEGREKRKGPKMSRTFLRKLEGMPVERFVSMSGYGQFLIQ
jgi:hypothetical protein